MRIIRLLWLHIKIFFHKNIRNYCLLITEIVLMTAFIALITTMVFSDFEYKIDYLETEELDSYAFLAINNSITNNLFLAPDKQPYNDLIEEIKETVQVTDVESVKSLDVNVDGLEVTHVIYDDLVSSFCHPVIAGKWLDGDLRECIIGGALTELYEIGDTILLDNTEYIVAGYLRKPFYYVDTNIGGTLSIYQSLSEADNIVITQTNHNTDNIFATLVLKYNPSEISLETIRQESAPYGTLYSVEELVANTQRTRNNAIIDNLPLFISLILICLLISMSGILISAQTNIGTHSVLLLLGETKERLILWNVICQGLVLMTGWGVGNILADTLCMPMMQLSSVVFEARLFSLSVILIIFIFNVINVVTVYSKDAIQIYRYRK